MSGGMKHDHEEGKFKILGFFIFDFNWTSGVCILNINNCNNFFPVEISYYLCEMCS